MLKEENYQQLSTSKTLEPDLFCIAGKAVLSLAFPTCLKEQSNLAVQCWNAWAWVYSTCGSCSPLIFLARASHCLRQPIVMWSGVVHILNLPPPKFKKLHMSVPWMPGQLTLTRFNIFNVYNHPSCICFWMYTNAWKVQQSWQWDGQWALHPENISSSNNLTECQTTSHSLEH